MKSKIPPAEATQAILHTTGKELSIENLVPVQNLVNAPTSVFSLIFHLLLSDCLPLNNDIQIVRLRQSIAYSQDDLIISNISLRVETKFEIDFHQPLCLQFWSSQLVIV